MKSRLSRGLLVGAVLLGAMTLLVAPAAAQGEPAKLRLSFTEGQVMNYDWALHGQLEINLPKLLTMLIGLKGLDEPIDMHLLTNWRAEVEEVKDEQATIELGLRGVDFSLAGMGYELGLRLKRTDPEAEDALISGNISTLVIDESANVVALDIEGLLEGTEELELAQAITELLAQVSPAVFPEEPVVPGQIWSASVKLGDPSRDTFGDGTIRFAYLGLERIDGRRCARIGARGVVALASLGLEELLLTLPAIKEQIPADDMPALNARGALHLKGDLYLDIDTGQLVCERISAHLESVIDIEEMKPDPAFALRLESTLELVE